MKTLLISFNQRKHSFNAKWNLDLHGFLTRDELEGRVKEINTRIRDYPLLNVRLARIVMYCSIVVMLLLSIVFASKSIFLFGVCFILSLIGCFGGGYYIDGLAKRRAKIFTDAVRNLFNEYNNRDNPTANWSIEWCTTITAYKAKKGSIKPRFADYVVIELDISDALSTLTANTVYVNLPISNTKQQAFTPHMAVEFAPCQEAPSEASKAPKAPTNLIIESIGTITKQPSSVTVPENLTVPT
ncbi:12622_t:CDS:2, partial [Funneliformis geosporum]